MGSEPGHVKFPNTPTEAAEKPDFRDMAPVPADREWYFTFGFGQRLRATRAGSDNPDGFGIPLDNCYVKIRGTHLGARTAMAELFGTAWCDQYDGLPPTDLPAEWIDITPLIAAVPAVQDHLERAAR